MASLGTPRKDLGVLHGRSHWDVCHWEEGQGHGASERQTLISTLSSQAPEGFLPQPTSFCIGTFFYITTLKILIFFCRKKEVNTDDVFQDLNFPYILILCLTFQWLLFKLTTAELQNVVFVLKTMTENFICIQMPTGLWYFNNKTAGLKAHDEKSD